MTVFYRRRLITYNIRSVGTYTCTFVFRVGTYLQATFITFVDCNNPEYRFFENIKNSKQVRTFKNKIQNFFNLKFIIKFEI